MIEQYEAVSPDKPEETLLERLKRQKAESERDNTQIETELGQQVDPESLITDEFKLLSSLAIHEAKTLASKNGDYAQYEILSSLVIIPDGQLSNAHNNEINFSSFIRRFLPESSWPKYIK